MDNTLGKLNEHLFEQMERLSEVDTSKEDFAKEIERSRAVSNVAQRIVENGSLVLDAEKFRDSKWNADAQVPKMLEGQNE